MRTAIILFIIIGLGYAVKAQSKITGRAFLDHNKNGIYDAGERPFKGLYISNGRDFVQTGEEGKFAIEKLDERFVFAVKPNGYRFALDKDYQARFYHTKGDVFDIPVYLSENEDRFSLVLMGDPQVYMQDQVNYLGEVATDELLDAEYEFMVVLGDLVGNTLPLIPKVKTTLGLAQKPNYFVLGNHDRDRGDFIDASKKDNDSFENSLGPDYYSFNWGDAHFLVLNNVLTHPRRNGKGSDYIPGIHETQLQFIVNDLKTVPSDKLIVVCAHIPFFFGDKKEATTRKMLELLKNHEKVFMATGHAHNQVQLFFDEDDGWNQKQPVHQLVAGSICGNWWRGEYDMFGIPGSMMRDGTPRGYWFMHVDGNDYQLEYKASGMERSKQMHIWVPQYFEMFDTLTSAQPNEKDIWINVYAGNEFTEVQMRIDGGEWKEVVREEAFDPYILRLLDRQERGITPTDGSRGLKDEPRESTHLWHGLIPAGLEKGAHTLEITAKDRFGLNAKGNRVFWVR